MLLIVGGIVLYMVFAGMTAGLAYAHLYEPKDDYFGGGIACIILACLLAPIGFPVVAGMAYGAASKASRAKALEENNRMREVLRREGFEHLV